MRIQRVTQIAGVTEKCVPGAGATPPCRAAASPSARSSLPPPLFQYPEHICRGYRTHLRRIQTGSVQHPLRIPN